VSAEHLMELINDIRQRLAAAEQLTSTELRPPALVYDTELKSLCSQMSRLQYENSRLPARPVIEVDMSLGSGYATAVYDDNNLIHSQHDT